MDPISELKQNATSLQEDMSHIPAEDRPRFASSCNRQAAQINQEVETMTCADMKYPFFRDLIKEEPKPGWEMLDVGGLTQERSLQNQDRDNLGCRMLEVATVDTSASLGSDSDMSVCGASSKSWQDKHADNNSSQNEDKVVLLGEDSMKASSNGTVVLSEDPHFHGSSASVKAEDPNFNGSSASVKAEDLHFHGSSASINAEDPNFNGSGSSVKAEDPNFNGSGSSVKAEDPHFPGSESLSSVEGNIHIKNCRGEASDECDVSGIMLTSVQILEEQKRSETKMVYFCADCGGVFNIFSRLETHIRSHIEENIHKPNVWGITVASKNGLLKHKRTEKSYEFELKHPSVKTRKRTEKSYELELKHPSVKPHKRTQKSYKCELKHPSEKPRKRTLIKKLIYTCDDCGIQFDIIQRLKRHIESHLEEKLYKCSICGVSFSYKCNLLRHKTLHEGRKLFKCEFCGLSFSSSYTEQEHRRTHTGEKPHLCEICGAAFTSHGNMLKHRRVHTRERPYLCDVCGVSFAWPWHLAHHKRTHTGERPYKCNFCGAGFVANSNLKKHRVIHTGERNYECDVCGKRFARQTNLQSHVRVHRVKKGV